MPRYDEQTATCRVYTFKQGLLSPVAHDLTIGVTRFSLAVEHDRIEGRFDANSLRVLGPEVLSAADRREIEARIVSDVLEARTFPEIHFVSTAIRGLHVEGTLSLHGQKRALAFDAQSPQHARVRLLQPDFGIRPYSAFFGTLRIKPDVFVEVTLPA